MVLLRNVSAEAVPGNRVARNSWDQYLVHACGRLY